MKLWRISNHADLSGIGGMRFSARWHSKGHPIIYTAEHPAGALSEFLVHIDVQDFPDSFQLITIEIETKVKVANLTLEQLSSNWMTDSKISRAIGNQWLINGKSLLLRVPSAILPDTFNVLITPNHGDAGKIRIAKSENVPLDHHLGRR